MSTVDRYREAGIRLRPDTEVPDADTGFVDLETLTVAQLHEYAAGHGIDTGTARLKAELVEVIASAPADPPTTIPATSGD